MTTVYIKGKGKYKKAIQKALDKSKLDEGDHYIYGVSNCKEAILYWITSRITLRDFKKAIGANIVFKHRLQFFENIEDLVPKKENKLSQEEKDLISEFSKK